MKHFKLYLAIGSLVFLVINLYGFYCLSDYLQKNEMDFCKINYCFKLLSIGEFVSITIAIIGIIAVIVSLDSWKSGQWYIERKDNFIRTKTTIQMIKDELTLAHASKLTPWDQYKFISMLSRLSNSVEEMQEIDINEELIEDVEVNRVSFFHCVKNYLSGSALSSDNDIKSATSLLIGSLQRCLEDLDEKYKKFKL